MKRLVDKWYKFVGTVVITASLFTVSQAQLVTPTTPGPLSAFEWKYTSDGSLLVAANAFTLHEQSINLPFGLDFRAGHGFWLGTRSNVGSVNDAQAVLGYEVYATKDVGSLQGGTFYLKGSLGGCLGPRTGSHSALTGFASVSAGIRF